MITKKYVDELFPKASSRYYSGGQILLYPGDTPQHVFYIVSGLLKYYDIGKKSNQKILQIFGPGYFSPIFYTFGILKEVTAFYGSLTDLEVLMIPTDEFLQAVAANAEFSNMLLMNSLRELYTLSDRVGNTEKVDAKSKIEHTLQILALNFGERKYNWSVIQFPVSQQFIADYAGVTRETVSAVMKQLEQEGFAKTLKKQTVSVRMPAKLNSKVF